MGARHRHWVCYRQGTLPTHCSLSLDLSFYVCSGLSIPENAPKDAELLSASSVQDGVLCLEVGSVPLTPVPLGSACLVNEHP